MEYDLIGCERFTLVIDDTDFSQERMHLDTFFNIITNRDVILFDFNSICSDNSKSKHRRVVVFEKDKQVMTIKVSNQVIKEENRYPIIEIDIKYYGSYRMKENMILLMNI